MQVINKILTVLTFVMMSNLTNAFVCGTYYSNNHTCIRLNETSAEFMYRMNLDEKYTMKSICTIEIDECGFIEINTISDNIEISNSIRIEYDRSISANETQIIFDFPRMDNGYIIHVATCDNNYIRLSRSSVCILELPKTECIEYFYITPLRISPDFLSGQLIGYPEFKYAKHLDLNNNIRITIPGISDDYFKQWRIKDEYIRIINDSELEWRGYIYRLQTDMLY